MQMQKQAPQRPRLTSCEAGSEVCCLEVVGPFHMRGMFPHTHPCMHSSSIRLTAFAGF